MTIKKVSVTKTSSYSIDGEGVVSRERIVEMSHNWTERDVTLFKKLAKQGGTCSLQGVEYTVTPGERLCRRWYTCNARPRRVVKIVVSYSNISYLYINKLTNK